MSKVSPAGPGKYDDLANTEKEQKTLRDFEKFTLEETDTERRAQPRKEKAAKKKRGESGSCAANQSCIGCIPPSAFTLQRNRTGNKFIQCDVVAGMIMIGYIFCTTCTFFAIFCYKKDSQWNRIVSAEQSFPELGNSEFFSNKRFVLYESDDVLRTAKKYLLRDNRWLELLHMLFLVSFLIFTAFQLAAYLTRGHEAHTKFVVVYFMVYGAIGAIVAFFPLFSWHNQQRNYIHAAHNLQAFSAKVWNQEKKYWAAGKTNGTAQDAWNLAGIMKFCYDVSREGLTIDNDKRFYQLYGKKYYFDDLEYLGFCTYHKYKIVNTILSALFALICCTIPCLCCFLAGGVYSEGLFRSKKIPRKFDEEGTMKAETKLALGKKEKKELTKFKNFIETDRVNESDKDN